MDRAPVRRPTRELMACGMGDCAIRASMGDEESVEQEGGFSYQTKQKPR